jgi:hypothetical protein
MAANCVVIIAGIALALVSLGGLELIDRLIAGEADMAEARGYDVLWQSVLLVLTVAWALQAWLRHRWLTDWLGLQGVSRDELKLETEWRLAHRSSRDRRIYRTASLLGWIGVAGIAGAIGASVVLPDGELPLRLSVIGKAIGGFGLAASAGLYAWLTVRNWTFEPLVVPRRRGSAGV